MLLSDRTPNLRDFESALDPAVQPIVYSFSSADGPSLVTLLRDQVRQNGSKRFESIAVVNFGPSSTSSHSWPLSAKLAVLDASELDVDSSSEAAHLFRCLGDSVVPGGRVDIFACGLLGTARGIAGLSGIRRSTRTHFAGSANLDANPANPRAQFMMESDGFDIKPLYFKGGGGCQRWGQARCKVENVICTPSPGKAAVRFGWPVSNVAWEYKMFCFLHLCQRPRHAVRTVGVRNSGGQAARSDER